jgi:hypothetical protein
MVLASRLFMRMKQNPAADWTTGDVETLCQQMGLLYRRGRGSHCAVSYPSIAETLTIPARRPIKPVYIRLLVRYIERHGDRHAP